MDIDTNNKKEKVINISANKAILSDPAEQTQDKTFLKENVIITLPSKPQEAHKNYSQKFSKNELNRVLVFRQIEKTEPTTRYRLSKELPVSYSSIKQIVRDLVFAGIVHEKEEVLETTGKMCKILTIPREVQNE